MHAIRVLAFIITRLGGADNSDDINFSAMVADAQLYL